MPTDTFLDEINKLALAQDSASTGSTFLDEVNALAPLPNEGDTQSSTFLAELEKITPAPQKPQSSLLRRVTADPLVSLAKGGVSAAQAGIGLLDLVSGGRAGKAFESISGQTFQDRQDYWDRLYSDAQRQANQNVNQAEGFWGTVKSLIDNPSTIAHMGVESVPSMVVGGGVGGKIVGKAAPMFVKGMTEKTVKEVLPVIGGALGEGAMSGGATADAVREQNQDGTLSGKQALLSGASGLAVGAVSLLGGKLAQQLSVPDLQTLFAGGRTAQGIANKANVITKAFYSGINEGGLQELPQGVIEQIAQNLALGKPWHEGVGNAAAISLAVGLPMGAMAPMVEGKHQNGGLKDIPQSPTAGLPTVVGEGQSPIVADEQGNVVTPEGATVTANGNPLRMPVNQDAEGFMPNIDNREGIQYETPIIGYENGEPVYGDPRPVQVAPTNVAMGAGNDGKKKAKVKGVDTASLEKEIATLNAKLKTAVRNNPEASPEKTIANLEMERQIKEKEVALKEKEIEVAQAQIEEQKVVEAEQAQVPIEAPTVAPQAPIDTMTHAQRLIQAKAFAKVFAQRPPVEAPVAPVERPVDNSPTMSSESNAPVQTGVAPITQEPTQPQVVEEVKQGDNVDYYSPVTGQNHKGVVTNVRDNWVSIVNDDGAPVVQKAENVKLATPPPKKSLLKEPVVKKSLAKPQGITKVKESEDGKSITYGTENNQTRLSVEGYSKEDISKELDMERKLVAEAESKATAIEKALPNMFVGQDMKVAKESLLKHRQKMEVGKVTIPWLERKLAEAKPQEKAKEPWEMTKAEYIDKRLKELDAEILATERTAPKREDYKTDNEWVMADREWASRSGINVIVQMRNDTKFNKKSAGNEVATHSVSVLQALSEGKPVPAEVLKDYPDLKPVTKTEKKTLGKQSDSENIVVENNLDKRTTLSKNNIIDNAHALWLKLEQADRNNEHAQRLQNAKDYPDDPQWKNLGGAEKAWLPKQFAFSFMFRYIEKAYPQFRDKFKTKKEFEQTIRNATESGEIKPSGVKSMAIGYGDGSQTASGFQATKKIGYTVFSRESLDNYIADKLIDSPITEEPVKKSLLKLPNAPAETGKKSLVKEPPKVEKKSLAKVEVEETKEGVKKYNTTDLYPISGGDKTYSYPFGKPRENNRQWTVTSPIKQKSKFFKDGVSNTATIHEQTNAKGKKDSFGVMFNKDWYGRDFKTLEEAHKMATSVLKNEDTKAPQQSLIKKSALPVETVKTQEKLNAIEAYLKRTLGNDTYEKMQDNPAIKALSNEDYIKFIEDKVNDIADADTTVENITDELEAWKNETNKEKAIDKIDSIYSDIKGVTPFPTTDKWIKVVIWARNLGEAGGDLSKVSESDILDAMGKTDFDSDGDMDEIKTAFKEGKEVFDSQKEDANPKNTAIESLASIFTKDMANSGKVVVVNGIADLPQFAEQIKDKLSQGFAAEAFYDANTGTTYLLSDNIEKPTQDSINELLAHEILVHRGLEQALGKDYDKMLTHIYDKYRVFKAWTDLEKQVLAEQSGLKGDKVAIADEVLAKIKGMKNGLSAQKSLYEKIIATLTEFINRHFNTKFGKSEIEDILEQAERAVKEGVNKQGKGDARLSPAFHGTPHVFAPEEGFPHGRFRLDKVGTGEGTQAYGWGIYFAENKTTGEFYKDKLPKYSIEEIKKAKEFLIEKNITSDPDEDYAYINERDYVALAISKGYEPSVKGTLYHLDIPDAVMPKLLDWDKPLKEQSELIKKTFDNLNYQLDLDDYDVTNGREFYNTLNDILHNAEIDEWTETESNEPRPNKDISLASKLLARYGIPGLQFLDGNSRSSGEGTHNYVIWDQKVLDSITLLKRNEQELDKIQKEEKQIRMSAKPESRLDRNPAIPAMDAIARLNIAELLSQMPQPATKGNAEVFARAEKRIRDNPKLEIERAITNKLSLNEEDVAVNKRLVDMLFTNDDSDPNIAWLAKEVAVNYFENMGTEQGRALQIRRDEAMSPAERERNYLEMMRRLPDPEFMAKLKKAKNLDERRKIMLEAVEGDTWAKIKKRLVAKGYPTNFTAMTEEQLLNPELMGAIKNVIVTSKAGTGDKIFEFYRNSLISALASLSVNLVGTAANVTRTYGWQAAMEGAFGDIMSKMGLYEGQEKQSTGELKYQKKYFMEGVRLGKKNMRLTFLTEIPTLGGQVMDSRHIDMPNTSIEGYDIPIPFTESIVRPDGTIGRKTFNTGSGIRLPQRANSAFDEFNKGVGYVQEKVRLAYRRGITNGLKDGSPEMDKFISDVVFDRAGKDGREISERALHSVRETAFQELMGAMKDITEGLLKWREAAYIGWIFKLNLPFIVTPAAIFTMGLRRTPAGALMMLGRGLQGQYKNNPEMLIKHMSEQAVAFGTLVALYALIKGDGGDEEDEPIITGSREVRRRGKREMEYRTYPAQSIKIGGKYYSYGRIDPFATAFTPVVDALEMVKNGKNTDSNIRQVQTTLMALVKDKTMLQGIDNIIETAQSPNKINDYIAKQTSAFMPNIVRSTMRSFDPYIRDNSAKSMSDIPKAVMRNALPLPQIAGMPKVDIWSRDVAKTEQLWGGETSDIVWRMVVPVKVQTANDIVNYDRLLMNWNARLADAKDEWWPTMPVMRTLKIWGKEYELTEAQRHEYLKLRGEYALQFLKNTRLNFNDPQERDIKIMKKAFESAGDRAKFKIVRAGNLKQIQHGGKISLAKGEE